MAQPPHDRVSDGDRDRTVEAPRRRPTTWTVAIMGSAPRRGRWRPAPRSKVLAFMGACSLDLRDAEVDGPELTITVVTFIGAVDVVVAEGTRVALTGIPVMGTRRLHVTTIPVLPGSPLVRVRAFPIMGRVTVRSRAPSAGDEGLART